jgi:hypothetical protein
MNLFTKYVISLFFLSLAMSGDLAASSLGGPAVSSGAGAGGVPYLRNITDRKRHAILIGDSMAAGVLPADIATYAGNCDAMVFGIGGDNTAFGATVFADTMTLPARTGNTLPDSRLDQWSKTRCTVTTALEPTSGTYMYHVVGTSTSYSALGCSFTVTADQAGGCYVSWRSVQSTHPTAKFYLLLSVGGVTKKSLLFNESDYSFAVCRYGFSLPSGWASENDTADIFLTHDSGVTLTEPNDYWLGDFGINLGNLPAPFEPTAGTAGTPAALALVNATDAIDRSQFDLCAIVYANDTGFGRTRTRHAYSSLINSVLKYCPRVLLMVPPPTYDTVAHVFVYDDSPLYLRQTVRDIAAEHNCYFVDTAQAALSLVASGQYTAAQLMQDQIHFSALGAQVVFARAIADTLNSSVDKIPVKRGAGADVRIGSLVHSGTWADEAYIPSTYPPYFMATGPDFSASYCQTSSEANATITYSVTGSQIALSYVSGAPGGVANVTVDGRNAGNFAFATNASNYPHECRVRDANDIPYDFGQGTHTVVCKVVSGTVKLIGCTGY